MKTAVCLGATGNLAFSVAHMVLSLKKFMNESLDNIIVFHDGWKDSDLNALLLISNKVVLRRYSLDDFKRRMGGGNDLDMSNKNLNHWSHMVFSIYEIFDLIKEYDKVLWLDCDIIIRGCFTDIFNFSPIAMRRGIIAKLSSAITKKIKNDQYIFNSGVVLVDSSLVKYDLLSKAYAITSETFNNLKYPDQTVLTFLCDYYGIKCNELPSKYHYFASVLTNDNFREALIIHTPATSKPWNNQIMSLLFPEFWNNYYYWLKLGGSDQLRNQTPKHFEVARSPGHLLRYLIFSQIFFDFVMKAPYIFRYDDFNYHYDFTKYKITLTFKYASKVFYKIILNGRVSFFICSYVATNALFDYFEALRVLFAGGNDAKKPVVVKRTSTYVYINFNDLEFNESSFKFIDYLISETKEKLMSFLLEFK